MSSDSYKIAEIDQCLPQTQCTLCTYPRCRDYAEALYNGEAEINQCPPGGATTIAKLSALLHKPIVPLNEKHGPHEAKVIALIDEPRCIGCKLCIKACPVDCIVGAAKVMHTVISDQCTGCKLCIPVCPTDCIDLVAPEGNKETSKQSDQHSDWPGFSKTQVEVARQNTEAKLLRITKRDEEKRLQRQTKQRQDMQREIFLAIQRKAEKNN